MPPLEARTIAAYWRQLVRQADTSKTTITSPSPPNARAAAEFAQFTTEAEILEALRRPAESPEEDDARRKAAMRRLGSPELSRDIEHALEPFAHLLERNPRSMKRLINAYGVERAFQLRTGVVLSGQARVQSVLWMITRLRWPVLADHLERRPDYVDLLLAPPPSDDLPDAVKALVGDPDLKNVLSGQGFDARLDADGVARFVGSALTTSTIGA